MNLIEISCRKCGGKLNKEVVGKYKCAFCGSVYYEGHLQREVQILNNILDNAKQESLSNLRKLLWQELKKEYTDSIEITSLCREIKKIYPEDFYANLYEVLNDGDEREVCNFLDNIDVKEYYEDIPEVLSFMMKSMQSSHLLSVSNLIERTYEKERGEYEKYMTEFEREAEKVEQGVYDPCLPRDVFVMYSSEDMEKVKSLVGHLEEQGITCFVAARNLQHGRGAVANYQSALEQAMDNCRIIVFVSSSNSRSLRCDAIRLEMPYVKRQDISGAPVEFRNRYDKLPDKYKKPRIEYLIENYTGNNGIEHMTKEFFGTLQWAQSEEVVAHRVAEILVSTPEVEDDNAEIMEALQEAEERRKKEAEEAEEQHRKELEEQEEQHRREMEEFKQSISEQIKKQQLAEEARRREEEARKDKEENERREKERREHGHGTTRRPFSFEQFNPFNPPPPNSERGGYNSSDNSRQHSNDDRQHSDTSNNSHTTTYRPTGKTDNMANNGNSVDENGRRTITKKEDKIKYGLICLLFGSFGLHNFMLGEYAKGIIKIVLLSFYGVSTILALFDFIKIVTGNYKTNSKSIL